MLDRLADLLRWLRERLNLTLPQTVTLFLVVTFIASLVCLLLFVEVADEMLDAEALVAFDEQLAQDLHSSASEGWTSAFALLTLFGSEVVFLLALLVAGYYALRRNWLKLVVWLAALGGGQLLNVALKAFFARERPTFANPLVVERFYSFPSGHAMLSMICYGLLAYFVLQRVRHNGLRALVLVLALVFIAMIGFSRLYLGVHFFSDVVAGYLAGGAWLFACLTVLAYIRQRQRVRERGAGPPSD